MNDPHLVFSIRKGRVVDVNAHEVVVADDVGQEHHLDFKKNQGHILGEAVRMEFKDGEWIVLSRSLWHGKAEYA